MSTDKSTIESYDEHAQAWAKRMRSKKSKSHTFLEKPAMFAKLPDLEGKKVLCVGCGSGEECQMLKEKGAEKVVGIDISKGLIEQAKYAYPEIEFHVMDMEKINFSKDSFDFVYSSLALHYVQDWRPTLQGAYKILKPGGKFLFSTHHPIRFSFATTKIKDNTKSILGYGIKDDTDEYIVFGDYLNPHEVQDIWFDKIKVKYYHKPFSSLIKEILEVGFSITDILEPKPAPSAEKIHPQFYGINQKIPLFLILEVEKRKI